MARTARRNSLALGLAAALAAAAGAQEEPKPAPPAPAQDTATFEDLRKSLGQLEETKAKEDNQKRDAMIQKNHEETLKLYAETLGKGGSELPNVSRRLEMNRALKEKHAGLLQKAQAELVAMRAQYIKRTMTLKKTLEEGKLSKEAHEKLLEEDTKRFRNREKELAEDIALYQEEIRTAERLMKELELQKELLQFDPFGEEDPQGDAAKRRRSLTERLQRALAEATGYRSRSVLDTLK